MVQNVKQARLVALIVKTCSTQIDTVIIKNKVIREKFFSLQSQEITFERPRIFHLL